MSQVDCARSLCEIIYIPLFFGFVILLSQPIRHLLRARDCYKKSLNYLVIFRQMLIFLFPWLSAFIISPSFALDNFVALVALGLSIIIFWVVELPLLMKADIHVTFGVDDGNAIAEKDYRSEVILDPDKKENIVNTRIQNLGFSTLKNAIVEIYFTSGIEVVPYDYEKYRGLDYCKEFSMQKTNVGAIFTPSHNFQTIPPQEWFIFQTKLPTPKTLKDGKVIIQFSSENSWGMKIVEKHVKLAKKQ